MAAAEINAFVALYTCENARQQYLHDIGQRIKRSQRARNVLANESAQHVFVAGLRTASDHDDAEWRLAALPLGCDAHQCLRDATTPRR